MRSRLGISFRVATPLGTAAIGEVPPHLRGRHERQLTTSSAVEKGSGGLGVRGSQLPFVIQGLEA